MQQLNWFFSINDELLICSFFPIKTLFKLEMALSLTKSSHLAWKKAVLAHTVFESG